MWGATLTDDTQPVLVKQESVDELLCEEAFIPPPEPIYNNHLQEVDPLFQDASQHSQQVLYISSPGGSSVQPLFEAPADITHNGLNHDSSSTDPITSLLHEAISSRQHVHFDPHKFIKQEVNNNNTAEAAAILDESAALLQHAGIDDLHTSHMTPVEELSPFLTDVPGGVKLEPADDPSDPLHHGLLAPASTCQISSAASTLSSAQTASFDLLSSSDSHNAIPAASYTLTSASSSASAPKRAPVKSAGAPSRSVLMASMPTVVTALNQPITVKREPNGLAVNHKGLSLPLSFGQNHKLIKQENGRKRNSVELVTSPPKAKIPKLVKVETPTFNGTIIDTKTYIVHNQPNVVTLPVGATTQKIAVNGHARDGPFLKPAPPLANTQNNPVIILPKGLKGCKVVKVIGNVGQVVSQNIIKPNANPSLIRIPAASVNNQPSSTRVPGLSGNKGQRLLAPSSSLSLGELNAAICDNKTPVLASKSGLVGSKPVKIIGTSTGEVKLSFTTGNSLSSRLPTALKATGRKSSAATGINKSSAKKEASKKYVLFKDITRMQKMSQSDKEKLQLQQQLLNRFKCAVCDKTFALNRILVQSGSMYVQGRPRLCIACHDISRRHLKQEENSPQYEEEEDWDDNDSLMSGSSSEIDVC